MKKRSRKSRAKTLHADPGVAPPSPDEITEAINAVIDKLGDDELDPFVAEAARRTLERTEWQ
jgi:hypothetical protein